MTFLINNILSWVASFILAFVVKCYDGWFIKPYFEHPEIPFVAYLGIVILWRILSMNFTALDYVNVIDDVVKVKNALIPTTGILIWTYLTTLLFGWILHFFI